MRWQVPTLRAGWGNGGSNDSEKCGAERGCRGHLTHVVTGDRDSRDSPSPRQGSCTLRKTLVVGQEA